jgi:hypothetical protein
VIEIIRGEVITLVAPITFDLLGGLIEFELPRLRVLDLDHLTIRDLIDGPVMTEHTVSILSGIIEPDIVGSQHFADFDLIGHHRFDGLDLHLSFAVPSRELMDGIASEEHTRPISVRAHEHRVGVGKHNGRIARFTSIPLRPPHGVRFTLRNIGEDSLLRTSPRRVPGLLTVLRKAVARRQPRDQLLVKLRVGLDLETISGH